jgi:hypothetical protein
LPSFKPTPFLFPPSEGGNEKGVALTRS